MGREGRKEVGKKQEVRKGRKVIWRSISKVKVSQAGNQSIITEEKIAD